MKRAKQQKPLLMIQEKACVGGATLVSAAPQGWMLLLTK
jgi:hypothetical protein